LKVELYHASKYGNGVKVAEEFQGLMTAKGHEVIVHHVCEANAKELPKADLYIFGSPGRIGKPIGKMRRFLRKINLPVGTRYIIFSTEGAPRPNKKTGEMPSEEEIARFQRVQPIMNEMLQQKGLKKVAEMKVFVTGIKGPLEEGWQKKVEDLVEQVSKVA
jgi:flavodoxin